MLQNLSDRVRLCYERAEEAREHAEATTDPKAKADFRAMEQRWLLLARSYQFGESLESFTSAKPSGTLARSGQEERYGQQFKALLLASASIVWWTNAAGEFVEEQPYWTAYTGQTWEEYRGSRWISCIHAEDREAVNSDWTRAVASGGPYFTQGRIWSAKHNAYRAFQTRGIAIKNERGVIEEWLGALTDVQDAVDLKLAEQSRRQLATIVETSRDAIWSWALDGTITLWNREAERMLRYTADEILGKSLLILVPPERHERTHDILAKLLQGKAYGPLETVRLRKDGKPLNVELSVSPIHDLQGRVVAGLTICRDITERKATEELFHRAIEAAPSGMLLTDNEGRLVLVNRQAEKMFGYSREELIGHEIEMLLPERFRADHPSLRTNYAARPSARPMGVGRELYALRKDATEIPVEIGLSPLVSAQGTMFLSAVVDITERKEAERRIAADLHDMTQLNQLGMKLVRSGVDVNKNMSAVIETAIAITRADKGNVQLFNLATGAFTIAAHRGFEGPFLKFFEHVRDDAYACSVAGKRIVVEDISTSDIFAGQPSKDVLIDAGVRAVISTPLIATDGGVLGMVSTHYAKPHRPGERELGFLDLLARQTADYLERKRAEELSQTLVREIQHRGGNLLAIVQAIANRSFSGDYPLAEARAAFEGRLQALAKTNRQLTRSNWIGVNLKEIVLSELSPYPERTVIEGSDAILGVKQALDFTLALHELATNAAKYGALSNGRGRVKVSWAMSIQGEAATLRFTWRETGGPAVTAPTRSGFGTSLLKAAFPNALISYAPDGLHCQIEITLPVL